MKEFNKTLGKFSAIDQFLRTDGLDELIKVFDSSTANEISMRLRKKAFEMFKDTITKRSR